MRTASSQAGMIILITGTSRGLGRYLREHLSAQGHVVVGSSRSPGPGSDELKLDVTDEAASRRAVEEVVARHGRLDALINNAGSHLVGAAMETSPGELRSQLELNFLGSVNAIRAALPVMVERRTGRVISISSIGGRIGTPFASAYNASKFALEGYSESLRAELLPFGVFVSTLSPGFLRTGTHQDSVVSVTGDHPLFSAHRRRVVQHMNEQGEKGLELARVGRTVEHILASRRPRLRYSVDGLAPGLETLRALSPGALFERVVVAQTAPGFGATAGGAAGLSEGSS